MTVSTVTKIVVGALATTGIAAGIGALFNTSTKAAIKRKNMLSKTLALDKNYGDKFDSMYNTVEEFEKEFGEIQIPTDEELLKLRDEIASEEKVLEIGKKFNLDTTEIEANLNKKKFQLQQLTFIAGEVVKVMNIEGLSTWETLKAYFH